LGENRKRRPLLFQAQALEASREIDGIHRMDHIEKLNSLSRFVRLQVSDQVPFSILASDPDDLAFRFLKLVLTKNRYTGRYCVRDSTCRMRLADRNQLYRVGVSACSRSGITYLRQNTFEIGSQIDLHRSNIANASRILEFQGSN
jgi:hypothetical protein